MKLLIYTVFYSAFCILSCTKPANQSVTSPHFSDTAKMENRVLNCLFLTLNQDRCLHLNLMINFP